MDDLKQTTEDNIKNEDTNTEHTDSIVFDDQVNDNQDDTSNEEGTLSKREAFESSRRKFFSRLLNKKIKKDTPEITKGVKIENLHSNFKRNKKLEGKPEDFPKKVKILSWQEEQKLGLDNNHSIDLELKDELAALAREVNAKN